MIQMLVVPTFYQDLNRKIEKPFCIKAPDMMNKTFQQKMPDLDQNLETLANNLDQHILVQLSKQEFIFYIN